MVGRSGPITMNVTSVGRGDVRAVQGATAPMSVEPRRGSSPSATALTPERARGDVPVRRAEGELRHDVGGRTRRRIVA